MFVSTRPFEATRRLAADATNSAHVDDVGLGRQKSPEDDRDFSRRKRRTAATRRASGLVRDGG